MENNICLGMCWGEELKEGEGYNYIMSVYTMNNYIILLYLSIQYLDIPNMCMKNNTTLRMCWGEVH